MKYIVRVKSQSTIKKGIGKIKRGTILLCLLLFVFFLTSWAPATVDSSLSSVAFKAVIRYSYFALAAAILFATLLYRRADLSVINMFATLTPLIFCVIQKLWVYSTPGGSISTMLLCMLFMIQKEEIKKKLYRWIKAYLLAMSVIGIICFVSYIINLRVPYDVYPYYGTKSASEYINYRICYFYRNGAKFRLCGLFNEPGMLGTFLAFCLCEEDLDFRKCQNIIYLIAGVLTFSLAFFIIIGIYFILTSIKKKNRFILLAFIAFSYLFILPQIRTGVMIIDSFIQRVSIENLLAEVLGERTTDAFDILYAESMKGLNALLGMGSGYSSLANGGSLSIKVHILQYGYFGVAVMYLPLLFLLLYKVRKDWKAVCFMICVMASLYQRPQIFTQVSFFMIICGAVSSLSDNRKHGFMKMEYASGAFSAISQTKELNNGGPCFGYSICTAAQGNNPQRRL